MKSRVLLLIISVTLASGTAQTPVAKSRVADAYGKAEKRLSPSDTRWTPISVGDLLGPNSSVRTGDNAAVILVLPDKHAFRIGEDAEVLLKEVGQNKSYSFELLKGQVWSFVNKANKPAKYEVETPSTVLGVSGTLFSVDHDPETEESEVSVADGEVQMRQGNTTHHLKKGFMSRLRRGQVNPAAMEQLSDNLKQMWIHLQQSENWTAGADSPKLNRQSEQRLRMLKQAQKLLRQRQQRGAAQQRGATQQRGENQQRGRGNRQQQQQQEPQQPAKTQ